MDRSVIYDVLLTFRSNHGPISYRFRDERRFESKIAIFSQPVYLCSRWWGSPWNWLPAPGIKKLEWWGTRSRKKFDDIFSRLDTAGTECVRQTNGRTSADSKDRAYAWRRAVKTYMMFLPRCEKLMPCTHSSRLYTTTRRKEIQIEITYQNIVHQYADVQKQCQKC